MDRKRVLILGAGLVARPMVQYLLDHGLAVTVASRTVARAAALLGDHPHGQAVAFLADEGSGLDPLIRQADLVVSLLPATRHVEVARRCLALGRPLVTTSYVSPAMQELDGPARERGLLFLNECGLDPGIDHMSAMQVINRVKAAGGQITGFASWCGGLPAPEANNNPWYYKFSWSPRGVLVAATNGAQWLENGAQHQIAPNTLFQHARQVTVPGGGVFEAYPNRDSASYLPLYGIETTRTMLRGTLRNQGHCARWQTLVGLGLLEAQPVLECSGLTYAALLRQRVGSQDDLAVAVAAKLGLDPAADHLEALRWLGLFEEQSIPLVQGAPIDIMADLLQRRLAFAPGERDMIVLKHEFTAEYPAEQRAERIDATMVDFGISQGDSAMARTVSLPAAIAVRRILAGELKLAGVHRPILPEIFDPLLDELKHLRIEVREECSSAKM